MQEPTLFDIAISSGMISLLSWPLYVFFAMTQGMTLATNSTKLEQLWWTLDTVWLQLIGGFSWHLPCTYDSTPEILIILTKKKHFDQLAGKYGSSVGLNTETAAALDDETVRSYQIGDKYMFSSWVSYVCLIWSFKGIILGFYTRLT